MAERPQNDLGAVLRQEAERHLPDGDAMFDRINRQRFAGTPAPPARPLWSFTGLRPMAAAFSVAATLVAGFTGIKLLTSDDPERTPTATTGTASAAPTSRPPLPVTTRPSPSAAGTSKHTTTGGGGGPTGRPHASRSSSAAPPAFQPVSGFVSSSGVINEYSTDTWGQSDVTITNTQQITALDLAISVARTAGVANTGNWSTVPGSMITITLTEEKDALIYRFTLKPGGVLAAGKYVFAAQYQQAGKRDPGADLYGAVASAGEQRAEVTGAFVAAS
ncbi:hypothetical protein [Actinoplanes awajinensis]|uniref:Uncharacterized protein n=1 Tax=Actinoplanes awajinensis subsp. mycoplanecinus TaxID=135947 RepID=A0A101JIB4_9ACTN|nr:hypothetical protein [Actinoplanes awajinensis]KUL27318.1 hypothetical protein ADL15_36100 [Actinoplanes awajinensis subsp. mycoplanecinus]